MLPGRTGKEGGFSSAGSAGATVWTQCAPGRAGHRRWLSLLRGRARCGSDRGRPRRQPSHQGGGIRTGCALRDQLFDLALRPVGGPRQECRRILEGEVRCQLADAGQVKPSVRQHVEELRMLARGPGRRDAQVGLRLGEVEGLGAIREHRRKGLARVEASLVDFAQVSHEIGLGGARPAQQVGEPGQQLVVGDVVE